MFESLRQCFLAALEDWKLPEFLDVPRSARPHWANMQSKAGCGPVCPLVSDQGRSHLDLRESLGLSSSS